MALTETPVCDFGTPAPDFKLLGTDGNYWRLCDCRGERGTLIMFICNHCPYVKAIRRRLVDVTRKLAALGVGCAAIMPNDAVSYPEDSYENMQELAKSLDFPFPYLYDETQQVAKSYGAVCTPDFFGYNADLELQYRGRLDSSRLEPAPANAKSELLEAMQQVASTGHGPEQQIPSMGCSIKWKQD